MKKNLAGKFSVTTIVSETGKIRTRESRPDDIEGSFTNKDIYIDTFENETDAKRFMEESSHMLPKYYLV